MITQSLVEQVEQHPSFRNTDAVAASKAIALCPVGTYLIHPSTCGGYYTLTYKMPDDIIKDLTFKVTDDTIIASGNVKSRVSSFEDFVSAMSALKQPLPERLLDETIARSAATPRSR